MVELITTVPCWLAPTLVPLKAKTPVILVEDCGESVVDPSVPLTLFPLVPVKTRLYVPVGTLLETVTVKLVLPPVMMALVPLIEVVTVPAEPTI